MYEEDIKAVREWLASDDRPYCYSHTEEEDGEDVMFVSASDFEDFADFLRENVIDLICIHGKIGNDGVWFSTADLEKAVFY